MMAAISAGKNRKVLLLEKNESLGKKLLLTGGGRCNVTNNNSVDFIIQNIIGNGKFLYSAFSKFNNRDIIKFFNERNATLKEEDHGRMFPITDSSKTILNALINELNKNNVVIKTNAKVKCFKTEGNLIKEVILKNNQSYQGKNIVLATGGLSFPKTGSTGDGYRLAKSVGHTVTALSPSEVPITSNEEFIINQTLMGLSLKDIQLSVLNNKNKRVVTHRSDMIFTHFGISGPAALRCSSFVLKQNTPETTLHLDCLPDYSQGELLKEIKAFDNKKSLKSFFKQFLPERLIEFYVRDIVGIPLNRLNDQQIIDSVYKFKNFTFKVNGTLPIEKSFVTSGGISLKEVNPSTMKSKLIDNLYFAGELLDINGYTGGYNITAALVSGYVAGLIG